MEDVGHPQDPEEELELCVVQLIHHGLLFLPLKSCSMAEGVIDRHNTCQTCPQSVSCPQHHSQSQTQSGPSDHSH